MADKDKSSETRGLGPVSGSRPPSRTGGSRASDRQTAFDRLAAGTSAHPSSREASATRGAQDKVPMPPVAGAASTTGAGPSSLSKSASVSHLGKKTAGSQDLVDEKDEPKHDGSQIHRVDPAELVAVQQICEGESAPLREEIRQLRAELANLGDEGADKLRKEVLGMKLDMLKFQQRQELQMSQMAAQLPSAEVITSLARDLGTVRHDHNSCLLYTSPSPRDRTRSRMPSSA